MGPVGNLVLTPTSSMPSRLHRRRSPVLSIGSLFANSISSQPFDLIDRTSRSHHKATINPSLSSSSPCHSPHRRSSHPHPNDARIGPKHSSCSPSSIQYISHIISIAVLLQYHLHSRRYPYQQRQCQPPLPPPIYTPLAGTTHWHPSQPCHNGIHAHWSRRTFYSKDWIGLVECG